MSVKGQTERRQVTVYDECGTWLLTNTQRFSSLYVWHSYLLLLFL